MFGLDDVLMNAGINLAVSAIGSSLFGDSGGGGSGVADSIAAGQYDFYLKNYRPVEERLVKEAQDFNTPERREQLRGMANADVTGAFDRARREGESRMQQFGINPASPAYQSNVGSIGLSEAATRAGALTNADRFAEKEGYSRMLDVAGIGRGIPAQSAASASTAAQVGLMGQRQNWLENVEARKAAGAVLSPIAEWGKQKAKTWWTGSPDYGIVSPYDSYTGYYAKGGKVQFTPHMKHYADGGEVGMEPIMGNGKVQGPGTGTSDSVPAEIDGRQPAALSSGEFVMSKAAVGLSGEEIFEAINDAGLKKAASGNNTTAYRRGGRVNRASCGIGG